MKKLKTLRKKWKVSLVIALVLVAFVAWFWQQNQADSESLVFVKPERQDLTKTLELSGLVDAKEKVRLRFLTGGKLTYVGVKEGDSIKKWQTVARIDPKLLQKQLEQQMNFYLDQRWDYEQYRDDVMENSDGTERIIPELSVRREADQEQWALENSVLNVEMKDIAVKETYLSSPISGIVTLAPAAVAGMQLTAADYFEIVNPESLVFKAIVDELDIAQLQLEQPAQIELDAYPDQSIASKISYISFASQQTTTGTVFIIELPFADLTNNPSLRLGMNGNATITLEKKTNLLSIPLDATRESEGKTWVDVRTTGDNYQEREVVLGLQTDEEVEIVSGLSETDEVLLPS
ncbi:MAG TPA: efflux RND transporter periplasmic adaptor subunit [Candidatus Woesebacteria bacterium]|nr:efflux RND transporter periplasmic adaptor subunit [Candidatus Woesebacteria bacterium]